MMAAEQQGRFPLRRERLSQGLSRRQAAIRIGVAAGTLRSYEEGGSLSPATAKLIAEYFEIDILDLLPEAA